jgi:hypothetical protein
MRPFLSVIALLLAVGCTSAEGPSPVLQGSWRLSAAHRALEPAILSLRQFGLRIGGEATVPGLDPVATQSSVISVLGSYSPPAVTLEVASGSGYSVSYRATLEAVDRLVGVLTFSDALGGGSDTVSYVRN